MTASSGQGGAGAEHIGPGRVPDELIDAVLDGGMEGESSKRLFSELIELPDAAREVASTQRAIDALKAPVRTPDMATRVLNQVGRCHGFTNTTERRHAWWGRVAAAAALVVTVGGAFAVQRFAPNAASLVEQPTPVGDLVAAVPEPGSQLAGFRAQLTCGLDELPVLAALAQPVKVACDVEVVATASDASASADDEITIIVMHRTQPTAGALGYVSGVKDDSLTLPDVWAMAQSPRPLEFSDVAWAPGSGTARVQPVMLVTPALDWSTIGQDFAPLPSASSGAFAPYR